MVLSVFAFSGQVTSEERVQIASWKDSSVHTGGFADEAALKKWVVNCLGGGAVQKLTLDGRFFSCLYVDSLAVLPIRKSVFGAALGNRRS